MIISKTDEKFKRGNQVRFPLLPLRDIVVFPHMVVPLYVGREKSIHALQLAMDGGKYIFLAAQKNAKTDDPAANDIYRHGTLCRIIQLLNLPDRTVKVLVEGKRRGVITRFITDDPFWLVEVEENKEASLLDSQLKALMRSVKTAFETYGALTKNISAEAVGSMLEIEEPSRLADSIASQLNLKIDERQDLLAVSDPATRLERLLSFLESETEILQLEKKIHSRVKRQMEKNQKEYYLNEQIRAIQKELGSKDDFKQELIDLEARITAAKLSKEAEQKAASELRKLRLNSPMTAEAGVIRNYLDWLVSLPWSNFTEEKNNIEDAAAILDEDHYGLEKIKERILEHLSVTSLVKNMKGPILCLVGPPGVGKTSLARSIARATGRSFVKMSLGGVRDEAEIRGHRRTYVGAMPGKVIQNLKKAGSGNPLFLLDEIDKMSTDFRGDPASALLEVLDPEQNSTFNDHFLEVDYDLSRVMFITTANSLHSVPRPLLDRLEVIRLEGYTETEKLAIAERHLVEKQLALHGLTPGKVTFTESSLMEIIRYFTREAGVRNLERQIAGVCRKIAYRAARGSSRKVSIKPEKIRELLGVRRFTHGIAEEEDSVGVVTGLAWTEVGGDLISIEVAILPGSGKVTITGKLGEVMQESAHAALTYVRSRASLLGLDNDFFHKVEMHIHVPEGAIPKDGPSAGITMATAITSALTGRTVRKDFAMTGEVTIRGRILPIGGLKEKLLAARRGSIRKVIIPKANEKDLREIPKDVLEGIRIHLAGHMDEVLDKALTGRKELPAFLRTDEKPASFVEGPPLTH